MVLLRVMHQTPADPFHPNHAEHAARAADITGTDAPFDPAFLDFPAVNRALAEQF